MKTYIIRLEENEHSCKMAKDCYDQAIKFNLQPEFFKAINGLDAEKHYVSTRIKRARKFKKNRPGVLGCFFSHYYLWSRCIKINEPIIILEHDGYFIRELPDNINDMFEDVLKLDRLDPYSKNYNNLLKQEESLPVDTKKYFNTSAKKTSSKKYAGSGNYFKGAYSYIIKPLAAKKLIDHITEFGHLPADQQIGDNIVNTMTTIPSLVRLHPFYAIGNNINTTSLTRNL